MAKINVMAQILLRVNRLNFTKDLEIDYRPKIDAEFSRFFQLKTLKGFTKHVYNILNLIFLMNMGALIEAKWRIYASLN